MAGVGLLFFGAAALILGQEAAPAAPPEKPAEAASAPADKLAESSAAAPDHSAAYYHYMLARRYRELAGINNRGDFVEHAIAEYKKAMEADPDSLFLRVELAELYWRMGRTADAVRDAELRYAQRYRTPRPNPRRVVIEVQVERVLGSSDLLELSGH